MESSLGNVENELSEARDGRDPPTNSGDANPGNSTELKESASTVAIDTNDVCEKQEEGLDSQIQVEKNGDFVKLAAEDKSHASPEQKSEKQCENSGVVLMKNSSAEFHAALVMEVENNHEDADKINCGSPIVISCAELPQIENARGDGSSLELDAPSSVDKEASKVISVADPEITKMASEGKSFTFDVPSSVDLSNVEASKKWLPFPTLDGSKGSLVSLSSSDVVPVESQVPLFGSLGCAQTTGKQSARGHGKVSPESKTKRTSGRAGGKDSSGKRNIPKESVLLGQTERGGKSVPLSLDGSRIYQKVLPSETPQQGQVDSVSNKPLGVLIEPMHGIAELKASALPTALQQPFTELQQLQLRAQILVYGSLISKLVPEEVHMISAFGGPDGGRSLWENVWRACKEKIINQTVNDKKNETPKQNQRASTKANNKRGPPNRDTSRVGQDGGNSMQPPVVNPVIPFSSPLWDIHSPYDASQSGGVPSIQHMLSPSYPNQAPYMGNYAGHGTAWTAQTPFPGSLIASIQTSARETNAHLFPSPNTEPVKLTTLRDSHFPDSSSMKNVPLGALGGIYAPAATIGTSASLDLQKIHASPGQSSADSKKPRKRKNAITSTDGVGQIASLSLLGMESVSLPASTTNHWSPVVVTAGLSGKGAEKSSLAVPQSSISHQKIEDLDSNRFVLTDETLVKVEEARLQAQNAEMLASSAVIQSRDLWDQLNKQKNTPLLPSIEIKLASAAAAMAVAASIAKAAAAAATVASNAALQVKLATDAALVARSSGNPIPTDGNGKKSMTTSISTPLADAEMKEAAMKTKVVSDASIEADNLQAIVKAAQLAAESITHVEKVISMGDSLPLSGLIEAGLGGLLKVADLTSHKTTAPHDKELSRTDVNAVVGPDVPLNHIEDPLPTADARENQHVLSSNAVDDLQLSAENASTINGISGSVIREETFYETTIKEGSHVEVFKDENGYNAAWFSAEVLSLKDGKAFVSYTELQSTEGSGKLKEWVELKSEGSNAPRIRFPHPITIMQFEGTRKRRRVVTKDFTFSTGDKVDALMGDRWWEGVVTEEDKKQETALTVHFPAHSKTSVVKAWQLRPSLIWEDGQWIEWSSIRKEEQSHPEGDSPKEKRKKTQIQGIKLNGKSKVMESANSQKSNFLGLTDSDKECDIDEDKDVGKMDKSKTRRAGLRKHDARVVFGVPKPGKKQKFMEVSKHYVDNKNNKIDDMINDSAKLANYLAPRVIGPHERRNIPKVELRVKGNVKFKAKVLKPETVNAAKTKDSSETTRSALEKNELRIHEKDASDIEESMKATTEAAEPRRSNRQIQPTSRLLEGLQSSMIGPKASSTSHDRGSKIGSKTAAKGK
ncbi:hypothetical protein SAY87_010925 [Trapa incisa]|uniref:Agenet domain-containing protein n=1 Tax=Trapa incisa TaxID=236973 RepID=A0AAN7GHT8_9MYRT|nr:hypothetical protein SAY87_010925 [Trapa incisa]